MPRSFLQLSSNAKSLWQCSLGNLISRGMFAIWSFALDQTGSQSPLLQKMTSFRPPFGIWLQNGAWMR
jgi:hypothetical protein